MPMFKIYVGNLDPRVKIEHVRELFSPFLTIEDAVLAVDAKTGKAKGFAIIMVRDPELGRAAVKATQGKRLLGKTLTINEVMKKGQAAAKAAKETRQGPFGPHFNRQGGGRGGAPRGGAMRRGFNRGPRGAGFGGTGGGPASGPSGGASGGFGSRDGSGGGSGGSGFQGPRSFGSGGPRTSGGSRPSGGSNPSSGFGGGGASPPRGDFGSRPPFPRRDEEPPRSDA